jgi:hypothetical protein
LRERYSLQELVFQNLMVLSFEQLMKSVSESSFTRLTDDLWLKRDFSSLISTSSTLKYEDDGVTLLHELAGKFLIEKLALDAWWDTVFNGDTPKLLIWVILGSTILEGLSFEMEVLSECTDYDYLIEPVAEKALF